MEASFHASPDQGGNFRLVAAVHHGKRLLIGKPGAAADIGVRKAGVEHFPLFVEFHLTCLCQPHDARPSGCTNRRKGAGKHGQHAVRKVGGIAPFARFPVQSAAWLNKVGDVRNVDGQHPPFRRGSDGNGVVKILGACRVNGDDGAVRPVFPPGQFPGGGLCGSASAS